MAKQSSTIDRAQQFIVLHARALTLTLSSVFVGLWTLLRFSNSSSIYDLVTQQVLAHSWLHGYTGQVPLGPTNYLLKVFLLYMPLDIIPGSPRLKLIALTLLINIATFILIFIAIEKILKEFGISGRFYLGSAMIWLSMIAGSVFWIEFANSRNLEVAGGMFVILLALRFLRYGSKPIAAGLLGLAAIVFFADSLQIYMVGLPLVAYGVVLALGKKSSWQRALGLAAVLGLSVIAARLLVIGATHLLSLDIGQTATGFSLPLSSLGPSFSGAAHSTLNQLNGSLDAGGIREKVNLLFLAAAVAAFVVATWRRLVPRRLILLVGLIVVLDEAIYIVSGQAISGGTSRYLITIAPTAVLAFASLGKLLKSSRLVYAFVAAVVIINGLFLGRAFLRAWDPGFPADGHLRATSNYLNAHNYTYALGSMDTATPLAYYGYVHQTMLFPAACLDDRLVHANAFRSTATIRQYEHSQALVPLILDQAAIYNVPNVCTQESIIQQFGQPKAQDILSDGSLVLLYPPQTLASLY